VGRVVEDLTASGCPLTIKFRDFIAEIAAAEERPAIVRFTTTFNLLASLVRTR
jgi:hypothetical protein